MHYSRTSTGLLSPVFFALAMVAAVGGAPRIAQAQAALPRMELRLGDKTVQAEVADSPGTRATGLMHRSSLPPDQGMLFVFENEGLPCFWMKDTLVPLDIAFIDARGVIANIQAMEPQDLRSHCPVRPVVYALEMEQGWFRAAGKQAGDKVSGLPPVAPARVFRLAPG